MSIRLHILLPVYNRCATTRRFVAGLRAQTMRDFHLVLLDDGSMDGTADAVRASLPSADVVTGPGHWWWAGALQAGCEHLARHGVQDDDVLLFINDDVEIAPDFLQRALAEFAPMADTLMLARQIDAATGAEIDGGGGVHADLATWRFAAARDAAEVNCLPTRGLFLCWKDFRRAGGFVPARLPHYLSDYEFTIRAARRGLQLRVSETAAVRVHRSETGRSLGNLFELSRRRRFGQLFSPGYKDNPVAWSHFIELAALPGQATFGRRLRLWLGFGLTVLRCAIQPVSTRVERN